MKKILAVLVCCFLLPMWAQQQTPQLSKSGQATSSGYDEKSIMLKQAKRYSSKRNYEKANRILEELIESYPDDHKIVEELLTNLLRMSEYDRSEDLLKAKRAVLPEQSYLRFKIPLLIRKGETKASFELADQYLKENRTNVKEYQNIARIFSGTRQYEKSAEILEQARKVTKDDYLYTLDLARDYQSQEKNKLAALEYLKHLEKNKHYLHYVMNNLKGILNREPSVINQIERFAGQADNEYVTEAHALSLAHLKKYQEALKVYENLDSVKLMNFAEELSKMNKYETAIVAYQEYESRVNEPDLKAEAQLARAEIYLKLHQYQAAETELQKVYENRKIAKGKYRYRTQAAKTARMLLADLAIRQDKPRKMVIRYLSEAAEYANNNAERKKIEFAVVDYQIKSGDLDNAKGKLADIIKNEESSTDIYKQSVFYTWQIALMQKDALADSLLGELILNLPDDKLTTQALYLTQIMSSLDEEYHDQLYEAWNLKGLYKYGQALTILEAILKETGNDEIYLLADEWRGKISTTSDQQSWQNDFENPLLEEYAELISMQRAETDSLKQELITDFLKQNPQSIFAPQFRNELNNLMQGGS